MGVRSKDNTHTETTHSMRWNQILMLAQISRMCGWNIFHVEKGGMFGSVLICVPWGILITYRHVYIHFSRFSERSMILRSVLSRNVVCENLSIDSLIWVFSALFCMPKRVKLSQFIIWSNLCSFFSGFHKEFNGEIYLWVWVVELKIVHQIGFCKSML
jgi:hypothetical protein